jgi:hypothetical protein
LNTLSEVRAQFGIGTTSNSPHMILRICCWGLALALGAAQAWATRFTMNPDGISYLDIGDAYWRGDWHNAINAYWSPLYSWILGFFLKVLRPSAYWEYPMTHLVNFLIYAATLGCFDFFLARFIAQQRQPDESLSAQNEVGIPAWAWWVLGYSLFVSCSIILIGLRPVNPDMCVAAFVFLISALVLKLKSDQPRRRVFITIGFALGCAYLAKTVMFPVGLVFLAAAVFASRFSRRALCNTAVATLMFLLIAGPFMAAISYSRGRPTFGDSGRLTYAACINGVDPWYPADGGRLTCRGTGSVEGIDDPSSSARNLLHPVRRIFDSPPTYSFTEHAVGTYPFWNDVSYWQEGIAGHFDARAQVRTLGLRVLVYLYLLLTVHLNLLVVLVTLLLISQRGPHLFSHQFPWMLVFPSAIALFLYAIVHTEYRYIAGFTCILWLAAFSVLRFDNSVAARRFVGFGVCAIALTTLWLAGKPLIDGVDALEASASAYPEAATGLTRLGERPAAKIGLISGEAFGEGGAFVARLASLQIIAQVNQPDSFWSSPASTRSRVLNAFRDVGCQGVLAWKIPGAASGWQRLGNTDYYFMMLSGSP